MAYGNPCQQLSEPPGSEANLSGRKHRKTTNSKDIAVLHPADLSPATFPSEVHQRKMVQGVEQVFLHKQAWSDLHAGVLCMLEYSECVHRYTGLEELFASDEVYNK